MNLPKSLIQPSLAAMSTELKSQLEPVDKIPQRVTSLNDVGHCWSLLEIRRLKNLIKHRHSRREVFSFDLYILTTCQLRG